MLLYMLCIRINASLLIYLLHRPEFTIRSLVATPGEGLCADVDDLKRGTDNVSMKEPCSRVEAVLRGDPLGFHLRGTDNATSSGEGSAMRD